MSKARARSAPVADRARGDHPAAADQPQPSRQYLVRLLEGERIPYLGGCDLVSPTRGGMHPHEGSGSAGWAAPHRHRAISRSAKDYDSHRRTVKSLFSPVIELDTAYSTTTSTTSAYGYTVGLSTARSGRLLTLLKNESFSFESRSTKSNSVSAGVKNRIVIARPSQAFQRSIYLYLYVDKIYHTFAFSFTPCS